MLASLSSDNVGRSSVLSLGSFCRCVYLLQAPISSLSLSLSLVFLVSSLLDPRLVCARLFELNAGRLALGGVLVSLAMGRAMVVVGVGKWVTGRRGMGSEACKVQQKRMQEGVREEKVGYTGQSPGQGPDALRFVTFLARSLTGWLAGDPSLRLGRP